MKITFKSIISCLLKIGSEYKQYEVDRARKEEVFNSVRMNLPLLHLGGEELKSIYEVIKTKSILTLIKKVINTNMVSLSAATAEYYGVNYFFCDCLIDNALYMALMSTIFFTVFYLPKEIKTLIENLTEELYIFNIINEVMVMHEEQAQDMKGKPVVLN